MSKQELIDTIRDIAMRFRNGGIDRDANDMERLALLFEKDEMTPKQCRKELDLIISEVNAPRGFDELCPPNTDWNEWGRLVTRLGKAAEACKKSCGHKKGKS